MAQYVRLAADLGAGRLLEQPGVVAARYRHGLPPAGPMLTVASPPANHHHFKSPLTVAGTVTPGSRLAVTIFTVGARKDLHPAVDSAGRFSFSLDLAMGENDIIILATDAHGHVSVVRRTASPLL